MTKFCQKGWRSSRFNWPTAATKGAAVPLERLRQMLAKMTREMRHQALRKLPQEARQQERPTCKDQICSFGSFFLSKLQGIFMLLSVWSILDFRLISVEVEKILKLKKTCTTCLGAHASLSRWEMHSCPSWRHRSFQGSSPHITGAEFPFTAGCLSIKGQLCLSACKNKHRTLVVKRNQFGARCT